jgi:hypothetical protein
VKVSTLDSRESGYENASLTEGVAVSPRSDSLADRIETRSRELTSFLTGLGEADLRAPTEDPGGRSAGEVVAHLGEGYHEVLAWLGRAAQDPSGAADTAPAGDGHHDHGGPVDVPAVVHELEHGGVRWAALVRGFTDGQLDRVPPATPGYTDGQRTLEQIVTSMLEHQEAHLNSIRRAVAAAGDLSRQPR